ncbi:DUF2179 domain-containing protein [Alkaliphilus serpentinus]|uniref:UPF0316 protein F8153_07975 n=1 Tax=Alkaliphilus serpentinus TaxID=1482731 RepID=A0A833M840_9FIRM|nr:DUF2179 domain-containing protein [Alkaliphilus serpentinus]KAB3530026.1 DUF2179 domain-containing protein [Alkaliphilus serpentinus]
MELFLGYLFIFVARVTDVSMATIRMIMVVRGRRAQAAMIGFFEIMIYVMAIGKVLDGLNNPINLLVYASGFATGNFVGIFLEEKMALGSIIVQVISDHDVLKLVEILRENGFGVTVVEGYGRNGIRHLLNITLQRKNLAKLHNIVEEHDASAFMTVMDARSIRGGYFTGNKKK